MLTTTKIVFIVILFLSLLAASCINSIFSFYPQGKKNNYFPPFYLLFIYVLAMIILFIFIIVFIYNIYEIYVNYDNIPYRGKFIFSFSLVFIIILLIETSNGNSLFSYENGYNQLLEYICMNLYILILVYEWTFLPMDKIEEIMNR